MIWIASDNTGKKYNVSVNDDVFVAKRSDAPDNLEYIDLMNEAIFAKTGESGYYVIADFDKKGSRLCCFIDYANQNGCQIVCRTNSTDCYRIADTFSADIIAKTKDGSVDVNYFGRSGGRPYNHR